MNCYDFADFLLGNSKHPLFYWVWPRMKLLLEMKIMNLANRLKEALKDKKTMAAEDHITMLIEAVNYTDIEWRLLINCAMAGKPSVKKFADDEMHPHYKPELKKFEDGLLKWHTFPDAIRILFTFNIHASLRPDYNASRVMYPMMKADMPLFLQ